MDELRSLFLSGLGPWLCVAIAVLASVVVLVRRMRRTRGEHDVVVIGGGAAGLTAAGIAASFGAKTVLVDRASLGGDCTWTGCVPSKVLLKAAKVAHETRHGSRYGLADGAAGVDSRQVLAHVRAVRQGVYEHADAPPIFEAMGIAVRKGRARFADPHTLVITDEAGAQERVRARYFFIATGARPRVPEVEGLDAVGYLTSESVFELEELPRRILVLGAGPIGTELAQGFVRLGVEVTVVHDGPKILPKDDPELTAMLRDVLAAEGVRYHPSSRLSRVAREAGGAILAVVEGENGAQHEVLVDAILVAAGRTPNIEDLDLPRAGVAFSASGITVDARCRTSAAHVYACGDVTGRYAFTHMAEHMAKVATTHALLRIPAKIDAANVSWCTFTDPELAQVGRSEAELRASGAAFEVYRFPYHKLDRAIVDGTPVGLVKVLATRATGKILGASLLGAGAGDLACELALAMRNGVSLRQIADTIHPYPTLGLGVRRSADQWYVRKRSRRFVAVLRALFGYRGALRDFDPDEIV